MPKMDGYEVCERLKANESTKHIPIIMITAIKADSSTRAKGLNCGADAFLSKPIEENQLYAQINVMLRIKETEDKLRLEKEQVQDSLSQSEEFLSTIYNNSDIAIFVVKVLKKGEYIYEGINKMHEKAFGLRNKDLIGENPLNLIKNLLHMTITY